MQSFQRIFLIVLDSVGIGAAPDAKAYHDEGANTLGNIATYMNGLHVPNLQKLGLGNIAPILGVEEVSAPLSYYTKMQEVSVGKDTLTGHWELMGLQLKEPFQTYPDGFPTPLIDLLEKRWGRKIIGNKPASGTEIIAELGEEHINTGAVIVYTSADSVLQIAAHEEVIPLRELYEMCEVARAVTLNEPYLIGRIIARPFVGEANQFIRTGNRRDYAIKPFAKTVLNYLQEANYDVISIGKIVDIFDGEGITQSIRTKDNDEGMAQLIKIIDKDFTGLSFLNLVDFDAKYGHRRDPVGYAQALERFDEQLPEVLQKLTDDDLLIITADHGNDPTHHGTDHTREYVPLLVYSPRFTSGNRMPIRETFADIGATIAENFQVQLPTYGRSFLKRLK